MHLTALAQLMKAHVRQSGGKPMRWKLVAAGAAGLLVAAAIVLADRRGRGAANGDLETTKGKLSYAMGVGLARNLNRSGVEVDMEFPVGGRR